MGKFAENSVPSLYPELSVSIFYFLHPVEYKAQVLKIPIPTQQTIWVNLHRGLILSLG